ncbi:hypothetical protein HY024_01905 [Candidatus Curtissbacteria bacterium]|nr:hypothetical protein [Candidatus Curtissbacteria bacterium]
MQDAGIDRLIKWVFAQIFCAPAILMPYKIRIFYIQGLSFIFHFPFKVFGRVAHFILVVLNIEPMVAPVEAAGKRPKTDFSSKKKKGKVAILFSGGTDSMCTAALMAQEFAEVHLLTFWESATKSSPIPKRNIELLRKKFPMTKFVSETISVDKLVSHLWYENYFQNLIKYRFLVLATCGFSSLSWHVRTMVYCQEHKITNVADGLTRELIHFPGHMDTVVEEFRDMYKKFGINYENPVRNWPTPVDQQFIDRVVVNQHSTDFFLGDKHVAQRKTTGQYLFQLGLLPSPNVKGSRLDFLMQHGCYPFTLYNIMAFWGHLSHEPYLVFCHKVNSIMKDKITHAKVLLLEYKEQPQSSKLANLLK